MKRRHFLTGLAATTAGSLTIGSGAFGSATAERSIHVSTVRDADSFLALRAEDTSIASGHLSGELQFEISPSTLPDHAGMGVGADSIYKFTGDEDGIFSVQNQGTEAVALYSQPISDSEIKVSAIRADQSNGSKLSQESPSKTLTPGDKINLGILIDTNGLSQDQLPKSVETAMNIIARNPREI